MSTFGVPNPAVTRSTEAHEMVKGPDTENNPLEPEKPADIAVTRSHDAHEFVKDPGAIGHGATQQSGDTEKNVGGPSQTEPKKEADDGIFPKTPTDSVFEPRPPGGDDVVHHYISEHHEKENKEAASTETEKKRRTIVIAVDDSEYSKYALNWSIENFLVKETDQVVLINVRNPTEAPSYYGGVFPLDPTPLADYVREIEENSRRYCHALLRQYASELIRHKISTKAICLRGTPKYALVSKINSMSPQPCVVIVASRGMGAIKRAFLGSTSDYLVHSLDVPVLVVKGTNHTEKQSGEEKSKIAKEE